MLNLVKRQIKELLHTLIAAGAEIRALMEGGNQAGLVNALADAQDAAVAIGNKIEAECLEADGLPAEEQAGARDVIGLLEKYCEYVWQITQAQDAGMQLGLAAEAWKLLGETEHALEQIPEQMAVVFMPYKASMWDCMESVWQAACEAPDCVPFVMPIPYFDLKDGQATARHYEGDRFPAYVPVVDYNTFPLEELHPAAVFVHNPFDDCNIVTSILPQYYSSELKKITDRLIYIPYYITGDGVFVTHRYFPSYENMDFIVTQCERTIASFSSNLPREKFLPFGSPIADRVLRLEKEKPPIPEEWKAQLKNGEDFGSDRTVMLNTSISLLMKQRERFLDKIEYLFDLAKERKGITLVWRPHPLLAASAQTMGEEYADRLHRLEEKFLGEKIGVLDHNPDVGVTVALCDAYLGETASSVIHMFGIAGKPRFYINLQVPDGRAAARNACYGGSFAGANQFSAGANQFSAGANRFSAGADRFSAGADRFSAGADQFSTGADQFSGGTNRFPGSASLPSGEAERQSVNRDQRYGNRNQHSGGDRILASAWGRMGNREYYVLDESGWLVERETGTEKFRLLFRIPGRDVVWGRAYSGMEVNGEELWVYPENAEGVFIYHTGNGRMRKVFAGDAASGRETQEPFMLDADEECVSLIRAEKFKRGNRSHVWNENDKNTVDDFFRFLQTAEDSELTGSPEAYATWLANLDGSCGKRVLQAVKDSVREEIAAGREGRNWERKRCRP